MTVNPIPVILFNPSNPTISAGGSVQLNAAVTGNIAGYLWTPLTGLNNPSISNPIAKPLTTTTYNLAVISADNCSADKDLVVKVLGDIYIPNSFTPNGDGKNDIFRIPPGTSLILEYFVIYDRYGNEVFKTADINKGWDGTYKGINSLNGAYTYIIKGTDSKREIILQGTILVIR
jgi:gliding motility-associated-like protein